MDIKKVVFIDQPGQRGYLPLAGAYMIAYCKSLPQLQSAFDFKLIFDPLTTPTSRICDQIFDDGVPLLVGFSCQGWNLASADAIAAAVRERSPGTTILYGGNHVTNQGKSVLATRPYVDAVINGEGEITFSEILMALSVNATRDALTNIEGVSFRDLAGNYVENGARARISDLDMIPSPYLTGVIDPTQATTATALLETNRGCPYKCSFCYWGGATNTKVRCFSTERLRQEMQLLAKSGVRTWYICDANFGMQRRDVEIVDEIVALKKEYGSPRTVYTNWSKHSNERIVDMIARLNDGGVQSTFTVALQSSDPTTLAIANRTNMRINRVAELAQLCRSRGVVPRGELIWGLPGESFERFLKSYDDLAEHTVAMVVHPHCVLPNTGYHEHREKLGIVTKRGDLDTVYEYCVRHNQMSDADFLKGMRFIVSNAVLQVAGNVFATYLAVAKQVGGVNFSTVILKFGDWVVACGTETAKGLRKFYRFPLATHRLVLEHVWRLVKRQPSEFLDMVESYLEEEIHRNLPAEQAAVLRESFAYDPAIYPKLDDENQAQLEPRDAYVSMHKSSYDFLGVQLGQRAALQPGAFEYEINHPKGLWRVQEEELYYGLVSFRGQVRLRRASSTPLAS